MEHRLFAGSHCGGSQYPQSPSSGTHSRTPGQEGALPEQGGEAAHHQLAPQTNAERTELLTWNSLSFWACSDPSLLQDRYEWEKANTSSEMGNTEQTLTLQPSEQSGFTKHLRSLASVSQRSLNAPPASHTRTDTWGSTSFLYEKRDVLSRPHSCESHHHPEYLFTISLLEESQWRLLSQSGLLKIGAGLAYLV